MSNKFFDGIMSDYTISDTVGEFPVSLGYTETGTEIQLGIYQLGHTLISGMSRSGKSRMAKHLLKSITTFADVAIFSPKPSDYIEFVKVTMLTSDVDKFGALIRRVVGTMERRNEKVYKASEKAGVSVRCDDPPIVLVVDEFATFSELCSENSMRSLKRLISEGAGLNIFLMLVTQVATKKILSDGLRENMMSLIAFKSRDAYASRMAIGDRSSEFIELGQCVVKNVDKRFFITRME